MRNCRSREVRQTRPFRSLLESALTIFLCSILFCPSSTLAPMRASGGTEIHGLWVWKSPTVLATPRDAENLLDFCRSQGINEVYVSVSVQSEAAEEGQLVHLIALLHRSNIRVEALLSSTDADEPGKHRDKLLSKVQEILQFNQKHRQDRFDGIHLDIEPQQRPENKGPGNLRFLPGLTDAFRAVSAMAKPARLTVNADIQNKLLKSNLAERKMLLSAVPRVTLMMYELSSPGDGESAGQRTEKARAANFSKWPTTDYLNKKSPGC